MKKPLLRLGREGWYFHWFTMMQHNMPHRYFVGPYPSATEALAAIKSESYVAEMDKPVFLRYRPLLLPQIH